MIFWDTESKGLVGPMSAFQWQRDDGPTKVHLVWDEPARETLKLIEMLLDEDSCGFNLTHDAFQACKTYCILRLLDPSRPPTIKGWLAVQREARFGPCLKPKAVLDLMLFMMRGPLQSTMERDDIRIRKVPMILAEWLAEELRRLIDLPGIYFEFRENGYEWQVKPIEDKPGFADVVLVWGASRGLKPIGRHVLGLTDVQDYDMPKQFRPKERLFDPFGDGWVQHSDYHDAYWRLDPRAKKYAAEDVSRLTYGLWMHAGKPAAGDTDSTLAWLVGASRWRGFALNLPKLEEIRESAKKAKDAFPRAPKQVMAGLQQRMTPLEAVAVEDTCAETLAEIAGAREGGGWKGGWGETHPATHYARGVVVARSKDKEEDMAEKLLSVGSFHPDSKVIGALSGRMSGAGGINMHGIPGASKGSHMREAFELADGSQWLSADLGGEMLYADRLEYLDAGDFDSFEVAIAAAAYDDANLTKDLASGKKIHAIYGSVILELEYQAVKDDKALYNDGKRGFLARLYGAQDAKIASVFKRSMEQIQRGEKKMEGRYPGIGKARAATAARFCSMRQEVERGRIEWHEPADFEESLFGDKRYFTLENKICRVLYDLGQNPPADLRVDGQVQRTTGRIQTVGGATQTAIFGCAFGLQASAMRQAANHRIQATGASVTKELQRTIWDDHQPQGVHEWVVRPMQIHDEIQCPRSPRVDLRPTVRKVVERYQVYIPLLRMDWMQGLRSWAEKG